MRGFFVELLGGLIGRKSAMQSSPGLKRGPAYPAITATLFVIHTHIVFFRLKPDLSSSGRAAELPFLAGGVCIVLACAFAGNWLLRQWTRDMDSKARFQESHLGNYFSGP